MHPDRDHTGRLIVAVGIVATIVALLLTPRAEPHAQVADAPVAATQTTQTH